MKLVLYVRWLVLACCLNRLDGSSAGPYGDPLASEALHTADPGYDSSKVVAPLSVFLATQPRSQGIAELERLLAAAQLENELLSARLRRMVAQLEEVKAQLAQTEAAAQALHNDFCEFLRSIRIT